MEWLVIGPHSFSWDVTSEHHPGARDAYRDSFAGLYEISDIEAGPREIFYSRTRMTLFGAGVIGRGRSSSQTLRRPAGQVRRAGLDTISLVLGDSPVVGTAGERSFRGVPGTILFLDHARPSASQWRDLDLTNLVVPREIALQWFGAEDFHGLSLSPDRPSARLLANHLRVLSATADGLTEAEGEAAIGAALVIAESALGGSPVPSREQGAALYRTVRHKAARVMTARLFDPGLSPDQIARACAVSRATLYRAFEGEGGLQRHLRERRLDFARRALAFRTGRSPTVADIAHGHGFASATHFSRSFRERFGLSPSDVPRFDGSDGSGRNPGVIRHDAALQWLNIAAAR